MQDSIWTQDAFYKPFPDFVSPDSRGIRQFQVEFRGIELLPDGDTVTVDRLFGIVTVEPGFDLELRFRGNPGSRKSGKGL